MYYVTIVYIVCITLYCGIKSSLEVIWAQMRLNDSGHARHMLCMLHIQYKR